MIFFCCWDEEERLANCEVLSSLFWYFIDPNIWYLFGDYKTSEVDFSFQREMVYTNVNINKGGYSYGKNNYTYARFFPKMFYAGLYQKIRKADLREIFKSCIRLHYGSVLFFPFSELAKEKEKFITLSSYFEKTKNYSSFRLKPYEAGFMTNLRTKVRGYPVIENLEENLHYLPRSVDLIIFSENKPMALYAFLESIEKRVKGLNKITVFYVSKMEIEKGYKIISADFPNVDLYKLSINPIKGYSITQEFIHCYYFHHKASNAEYFLLALDTMIVNENIDFGNYIDCLEEIDGVSASLLFGENIKRYDDKSPNFPVPTLQPYDGTFLTAQANLGSNYYGITPYPYFRLIKKEKILEMVKDKVYINFHKKTHFPLFIGEKLVLRDRIILFKRPKVSIVDYDFSNVERKLNEGLNQAVSRKFIRGKKIDIDKIRFNSKDTMVKKYKPTYTSRYKF